MSVRMESRFSSGDGVVEFSVFIALRDYWSDGVME